MPNTFNDFTTCGDTFNDISTCGDIPNSCDLT